MITVAGPIDREALHLRGEFLEFPGLIVTPAQAARLLGIRLEHAVALLTDLEQEDFLARTATGSYRRASAKKES